MLAEYFMMRHVSEKALKGSRKGTGGGGIRLHTSIYICEKVLCAYFSSSPNSPRKTKPTERK
jgi:hypothetical protein